MVQKSAAGSKQFKLSEMTEEISSLTNLSLVFTNHSVRATAITLWANAGLTKYEIMAIAGHCNESILQRYLNMSWAQQLRKCSDALSSALGDDQSAEKTQKQLVVRPPLQELQVPSINTSIFTNQQSTWEHFIWSITFSVRLYRQLWLAYDDFREKTRLDHAINTIFFKSNRRTFCGFTVVITYLGCWKNARKARTSLAFGSFRWSIQQHCLPGFI